jgi:sRNA-binding carbon storage regulator CsrA
MLVLSRLRGEEIEYDLQPLIDAAVSAVQQGASASEMRDHLVSALEGKTSIRMSVVSILGNRCRLGTDAARMIPINRGEIVARIAEEAAQR